MVGRGRGRRKGGEMTQTLYTHMNKKKESRCSKYTKMVDKHTKRNDQHH
jgi:hypothetical protein